jgi:hypothetical protein
MPVIAGRAPSRENPNTKMSDDAEFVRATENARLQSGAPAAGVAHPTAVAATSAADPDPTRPCRLVARIARSFGLSQTDPATMEAISPF